MAFPRENIDHVTPISFHHISPHFSYVHEKEKKRTFKHEHKASICWVAAAFACSASSCKRTSFRASCERVSCKACMMAATNSHCLTADISRMGTDQKTGKGIYSDLQFWTLPDHARPVFGCSVQQGHVDREHRQPGAENALNCAFDPLAAHLLSAESFFLPWKLFLKGSSRKHDNSLALQTKRVASFAITCWLASWRIRQACLLVFTEPFINIHKQAKRGMAIWYKCKQHSAGQGLLYESAYKMSFTLSTFSDGTKQLILHIHHLEFTNHVQCIVLKVVKHQRFVTLMVFPPLNDKGEDSISCKRCCVKWLSSCNVRLFITILYSSHCKRRQIKECSHLFDWGCVVKGVRCWFIEKASKKDRNPTRICVKGGCWIKLLCLIGPQSWKVSQKNIQTFWVFAREKRVAAFGISYNPQPRSASVLLQPSAGSCPARPMVMPGEKPLVSSSRRYADVCRMLERVPMWFQHVPTRSNVFHLLIEWHRQLTSTFMDRKDVWSSSLASA